MPELTIEEANAFAVVPDLDAVCDAFDQKLKCHMTLDSQIHRNSLTYELLIRMFRYM